MHETSTDKSCVYRGAAAVTASVRDAKLMTRVPSLPILSCEGVSLAQDGGECSRGRDEQYAHVVN